MFRVDIQVRFRDLDAYGHVNSVVYYTYLEQARVEMLKHLNFLQGIFKEALLFVARSECTYKHPISLEDKVYVELWVEHIGRSSFELGYNIKNDKTLFATAKTLMVCVHPETNKPIEIPLTFRKGLEELKQ